MFSYLFGKKDHTETPTIPAKEEPIRSRILSKQKPVVYIVVDKNSNQPLGAFDTIAEAKKEGERVSYYNCSIYSFKVNDKCNYLLLPTFEN